MNLVKINKNLIFLIFTAVLFQIYLFMQKENFHIDEMLSFIAANNDEGIYLSRNWSDTDDVFIEGEKLAKILTKQPNGLNLIGVWNKISQGVHMPVFYVLLNTFYFTGSGEFSPLSGMVLNIIVLIFLLWGFYKLSKLLFKDENIAVVIVGILAFSQNILSLEVYIRMYLLLMAFSVWLMYFVGQYFFTNKNKYLFLVLFLTYLTILTHYYSLIFCFLFTSFVCLFFLLQKKYKPMFLFGITMLLAVFLAYLSFPTMINSGFHSERGSQFWVILNEFIENPVKILKQQIPLFVDTMFGHIVPFIGFILLMVLCSFKSEQGKYVVILFFVFIFYGFLTALVMPVMLHFQIRYFAPIIPIFTILIGFVVLNLGTKYKFSHKGVFGILCFMMLFIGVKNIIWQNSPFYMHGTRNSRKMENLVKGADIWWGFGGGWQYAWMLSLYVDKLSTADKTWVLADYNHPEFKKFSQQEVKDKKYAYLFMPTVQEQHIEGAINWIKQTTGRNAYYLFTSKLPNTASMVFEASVYLVLPY